MSETKSPQAGTAAKPAGPQQAQQGQPAPASQQQQAGTPIIRDWAAI